MSKFSEQFSKLRRRYRRQSQFRFNLGIPSLLPAWRAFLSPLHLREDIIAGITVACVAVPLSLAIALASGVSPAAGLVTAIVAGVVCALFGGTPLAVSGPAAAMAVLIAATVERHGLSGLFVVGLLCGILQLLSGALGLGRLIRYVPTPVVAGFTAGIGAIILIGQLPRALGLPPPDQSHVVDVLKHLAGLFHEAKPAAFLLAASTVLLAKGLPRFAPKLPAPLLAVALPSLAALFLSLEVPLIGTIPRSLPWPTLPPFPTNGWGAIFESALLVYALASLETLLSSSAVDKLSGQERHDPDQELIGQGLGNMAVSFFGGVPVTGVIARSGLNVRAGARTRRAAILHSLALLAIVYVAAPVIARIPIATLAGVLIAVALGMLSPREFLSLLRQSRSEALVFLVTFTVIVSVDLVVGVQAGMAAALFIAVLRLGQTRFLFQRNSTLVSRLSLSGPLTFLASARFEQLEQHLAARKPSPFLVLELSGVTDIDSSGAAQLVDFVAQREREGMRVVVKGLGPELQRIVVASDEEGIISAYANSEADVPAFLESGGNLVPHDRLVFGVDRFRAEKLPQYAALFESLVERQRPHTLFITCSDSRINPNLITSTDPGELFLVRNVGNLVPRYGSDEKPAEGAAVEYALNVLQVQEIIICGHIGCGAMAAVLLRTDLSNCPSLVEWLSEVRQLREEHREMSDETELVQRNVLVQLENLRSYEIVNERIAQGKLQLRAWIYDMRHGDVLEWSGKGLDFTRLGGSHERTPRSRRKPML